ncbi:MAG: phospholipid carrier-dependent glycosyltransferase, partial [Verrucomicrobiia bacterium]
MEFPLYQWTAAWLGQQFDLTTALSGRVVSIFCFYLCLPAIVLLLREIRFQPEQINYVLVLVLTAPVFIYFTRAILIESTALCFSLWFLYGFIRLSRSAHWGWWLLTFICGSLAAVVKVTTFMVWGIGALVGGIWWFLKIRRTLGAEQANRNLSWAAISAIPPILAGIWWVATADRIKRQSPDGLFLTSENLRDFNLGSWSDRIDFSVWESL